MPFGIATCEVVKVLTDLIYPDLGARYINSISSSGTLMPPGRLLVPLSCKVVNMQDHNPGHSKSQ